MLYIIASYMQLIKPSTGSYITHIGDPTFFGNLPVHKLMKQAVKDAVDSDKFNGYGSTHGEKFTIAEIV